MASDNVTLTRPKRASRRRGRDSREQRWVWGLFSGPGIVTLILLFIVPFYVVIAIAAGTPRHLRVARAGLESRCTGALRISRPIFHDLVGRGAFIGPTFVRTVVYVVIASILSLVIAYPTAYFVTRWAGRRKVMFLVLLIAPFWVSYMMRMLAWIDLLQTNGYINKVLGDLHITSQPVNWLGGKASTVIFGLVYGYIPYLILVLYAGTGPDRPAAARGRSRPRAEPVAHLHASHPAAEPPDDHDRDADHGAADDGRLLHQPAALGHAADGDDRQPHRRSALHAGAAAPGERSVAAAARRATAADGVLRVPDLRQLGQDRLMAVDTPTRVAPRRRGPGETVSAPTPRRRKPPWRNPWRHAWFLEGFTWLYLIWSIVPIGLAVLFSFNKGKSQSVWQGFSLRWYITDPVNSVLHGAVYHQAVIQTLRLSALTTVITVPFGRGVRASASTGGVRGPRPRSTS